MYLFGSFSGSNRPPWKHVRYSDFVEKSRLLISVLGGRKKEIDQFKENLQNKIQKLVRKVCNGVIFSCIKAVSFIRGGNQEYQEKMTDLTQVIDKLSYKVGI